MKVLINHILDYSYWKYAMLRMNSCLNNALSCVLIIKCYPRYYWTFFLVSLCLIKVLHPHSASHREYFIQTGNMCRGFFFSFFPPWPGLWAGRLEWWTDSGDRCGASTSDSTSFKERMPGVDGRTVCLTAEGESTRDGQTAGVASLRMVQIALSLRIPVTSLLIQRHNGWLWFVTV